MRHLFMSLAIIASVFIGTTAHAQIGVLALPEPVAGEDYAILPTPVPTSEPNKIEVKEIFWYGCPHCYHLEPVINSWSTQLPEDIHFVRMPALFSKVWTIHGQLFVTLDTLNVEDKLHSAIFESIQHSNNVRKKLLLIPDDMADFVEVHGVNREKFLETYNSFGVQTKMAAYKKLLDAYHIQGVPVIIVNGKYRVEMNEKVSKPEEMMRITNYLIEKERKALKQQQAEKTPVSQEKESAKAA